MKYFQNTVKSKNQEPLNTQACIFSEEQNTCYIANKYETGRSMVEMLGVLAVIGVLSVGSIMGYTFAMNKYHSNEIFHEISERATMVSVQVMSGNAPSLAEFKRQDFGYAVFDDKVYGASGTALWDVATDKKFALKLTEVNKAVCQNLKTMVDATVQGFEPAECGENATVVLTYNNDLSSEKIDDTETPKDDSQIEDAEEPKDERPQGPCEAPLVWCEILNKCQNTSDVCACPENSSVTGTGDAIFDTKCKCNEGYKIYANGQCLKEFACDPGCGEGQFCYLYTDDWSCNVGPKLGVCDDLEPGTVKYWKGKKLLVSSRTNYTYWAAQSWCEAHGMKLLDFNTLDMSIPNEADATCDFPPYTDGDGKIPCKNKNGVSMKDDDSYANILAELKEALGNGDFWTRHLWKGPAPDNGHVCPIWYLTITWGGTYYVDLNESWADLKVVCE